jgi:Envelope integrity protein A
MLSLFSAAVLALWLADEPGQLMHSHLRKETSEILFSSSTVPRHVGGLGMTALSFNNIVVVPVRSGVGLRLGANVGYLKFTPTSTWNPF